MLYLIDGNNLLFAAQTVGPERAIGRVQLCHVLDDWTARQGVSTCVVFDGPPPREHRPGDPSRRIQVRYSGRRTADELIEEMVAQSPHPGEITVVTTDRAIQHAVRYHRSRCIDSQNFVPEMYSTPSPAAPPQPPDPSSPREKPAALSKSETDRWLDEFGLAPDEFKDDADLMDTD